MIQMKCQNIFSEKKNCCLQQIVLGALWVSSSSSSIHEVYDSQRPIINLRGMDTLSEHGNSVKLALLPFLKAIYSKKEKNLLPFKKGLCI